MIMSQKTILLNMKKGLMKDKTIKNYTATMLEIKLKKTPMEQKCLYPLFQEKIKQELKQAREFHCSSSHFQICKRCFTSNKAKGPQNF